MPQMSEVAELMSFLTLTSQAKLKSNLSQSTEQTFEAHLRAKAAAQAWLQRMAAGDDKFEYREDMKDMMDVIETSNSTSGS